MAGDDPREILRLERCPDCGYDIAGLPPNHRCPECGFAYDESMLMLAVWPENVSRPKGWELPIYIILIGASGIAGLALLAAGRKSWLLLGTAGMLGLALWSWWQRRRKQLRGEGIATVLICRAGIGYRSGGAMPPLRPWSSFRKVQFRRVGHGLWRLRASWRWWRWSIRSPIVAYVECSDEEGRLLSERLEQLTGR